MRRIRTAVLPTLRAPVVTWRDVFSRGPVLLLFISVLLILVMGLVALASLTFGVASEHVRIIFTRQLAALGFGVVLAVAFAHIDYRFWKSAQWILFLSMSVLLFALLFFGTPVRGSRAWLYIGGISIQVSEVAKFSFLIFLSSYAGRWTRELRKLRHLVTSLLGATVFVLLIFFEPDVGSAALFVLVWVSFILAIGLDRRQLLAMACVSLILGAIVWFAVLAPYQQERVLAFVNPTPNLQGSGYNLHQSLVAIGSGGIWGRGFAQGSQSQFRYLPEAQSDFLFAVIAENFGLIGVALLFAFWIGLFGSFVFLFHRLVDDFAAFYCLALALFFFWETIIPIAMNLGVLPVTGLALPLMSAGGSSLVVHLAMLGVLFNIIKNTPLRLRDTVVELG